MYSKAKVSLVVRIFFGVRPVAVSTLATGLIRLCGRDLGSALRSLCGIKEFWDINKEE